MTAAPPEPQERPCAPCAERAAGGPHELRPESLPLDVVPRHAPDLGHWKQGTEVVVGRGGDHPEHVLNSSAGTIWLNLDGSMSVGSLVDALHDQTGAPRDVIERDVRSAVVRMVGIGILVVDLAG